MGLADLWRGMYEALGDLLPLQAVRLTDSQHPGVCSPLLFTASRTRRVPCRCLHRPRVVPLLVLRSWLQRQSDQVIYRRRAHRPAATPSFIFLIHHGTSLKTR